MVHTRRPRNSDEAGDEFIPEEDVQVWNSSSEESSGEENSAEEADEMPQTEAEARAAARRRHRARMRVLLEEREQLRLQQIQEDELLRQEIGMRLSGGCNLWKREGTSCYCNVSRILQN